MAAVTTEDITILRDYQRFFESVFPYASGKFPDLRVISRDGPIDQLVLGDGFTE
jgi:hypothetical protein